MESADLPWGPYELRPHPAALVRLALGTSAAISTALAIPDAFAIMPTTLFGGAGAEGVLAWLIRVVGLWLWAFMLWSSGFLALANLSGILSGGIVLSGSGIKLWRFGKLIPWSSIVAVSVTRRVFFSRAFFLSPCVLQMTLHVLKKDGRSTSEKQIPSFQFTKEQFASLLYHIGKRAFDIQPSSPGVFMFKPGGADNFKVLADKGKFKRIALSLFIASTLIFVLTQKSACFFMFNTGNKFFRQGDYKGAMPHYRLCLQVFPAFPQGWDKLARCEYRTGNWKDAEEHWRKALFFKPDLVDAKIGLSLILLKAGNLEEAEKYIRKAVSLARTDLAPQINLEQLELLKGNYKEAQDILEKLLKQNDGRDHLRCLLVQCMIRRGRLSDAEVILNQDKKLENDKFESGFYKVLCAELAIEKGEYDSASRILSPLEPHAADNPNALYQIARVKLHMGKPDESKKLLTQASSQGLSPSLKALLEGEAYFLSGDMEKGWETGRRMTQFKYPDAAAIARLADAGLKASPKDLDRARNLAQSALLLDGENRIAAKIAAIDVDRGGRTK